MENLAAQLTSRRGHSVAIIGGGWAGLACAVECARLGLRPAVFEAAPNVGGRARAVTFDGLRLDNGQHILIGAYHATLSMMRAVGADPDTMLQRVPLALRFTDGFELRARSGSRIGLAAAFLGSRSLDWRDRFAALRLMAAIRRSPADNETVADLLARTAQTENNIRHLWVPLCIAALNTGIDQASAHVFGRVLHDSLMGAPGSSDLLLPRVDLGQLFPEPAAAWLAAHDCPVRTGTRIERVTEEAGAFVVETGTTRLDFDRVVFAGSPHGLSALAGALPQLATVAALTDAFDFEPITTVYAAFDSDIRLPYVMSGFADGVPHWVFDRSSLGGPAGLLACVVSAERSPRKDTEHAVLAALRNAYPALPDPLWVRTITERRATFRCTPERPVVPQPADERIALAGDYLSPDYPATLESAVRSGIEAAHRIAGATVPGQVTDIRTPSHSTT